MATSDRVIELIASEGPLSGQELADRIGITRQAVHRHIRRLLLDGEIAKSGSTRNARYRIANSAEQDDRALVTYRRVYSLEGLEEDRVFDEVDLYLGLRTSLSAAAYEIYRYALTEMVNNAAEHSYAKKCTVSAEVNGYKASFVVVDRGIGLFRSVADRFELRDESEAVVELSKGKRTSMPERHSGEGIFFTSKCADRFEIHSHKVRLIYDNLRPDLFVEETPPRKGTAVSFEVKRRSKRLLARVFSEYAPEDFDFTFQKTEVDVGLIRSHYASRSEAKRLMSGLEKFRRVVLDFSGVRAIGQGFADEVFRVFVRAHPEIELQPVKANEIVGRMISHVRRADDQPPSHGLN